MRSIVMSLAGVLAVTVCLLRPVSAQTPQNQSRELAAEDSSKAASVFTIIETEPQVSRQWGRNQPLSPGGATAYAIIPGFFVHGIGHLYAHDYRTGAILFGVQVVAGTWFIAEIFGPMMGRDHDPQASIAVATFAAYWVSWIYDIVHAGAAASQYNARFNVALQPERDGVQLCLRLRL
jgi:hypothetical protein